MKSRKRSIDMLSGLPDEVLCHILSFLPTKTSLSTSVLAKRWRFLWAHVPTLKFVWDNFKAETIQPMDIISRVVMLHEAKHVNTLWLSDVNCCAYQLETLVIYSMKRNLRNLYLDFGSMDKEDDILCTLPRLLLTCKTLVDLKLSNCGVIRSSGELFLPSLEKLNLSYVQYEDDESLPHLLSRCPVLEELTIDDWFRKEEKNPAFFIVASPTVKKLNVDRSMGVAHRSDVMLIIDAPALIYLKVSRCHLGNVRSLRQTMTSLIEAKMIVNDGGSNEFLSCLRYVRCLKISTFMTVVDIVGSCSNSMPKFVNLTKLEIQWIVNWHYLVKFLEVADNLQVLFISLLKTPPYKEPKRVPTCLVSCLKTVTVFCFNPCEDSFDIVRYILRNAQVLEKMEIRLLYDYSSNKLKSETLERISMFERVSKSCQVDFITQSFV